MPRAEPGAASRRIVVVGGGPAGMAAAVEAGARGNEVVLLERAQLGGQVRLLAGKSPPTHAELAASMMANDQRHSSPRLRQGRTGSRRGCRGDRKPLPRRG